MTFGFAGIGSASQLCGLLFFSAIEASVDQIPHKGTGPALNDLVGGQFDFMCDQTLNVLPPVKAGLIKAYAVTTDRGSSVAPDLPTASKAGLPGLEIAVWFAMYAPKSTPKRVIETLSEALQKALKDPEVKSRLSGSGAETVAPERRTPEALRAHPRGRDRRMGTDHPEGRAVYGHSEGALFRRAASKTLPKRGIVERGYRVYRG